MQSKSYLRVAEINSNLFALTQDSSQTMVFSSTTARSFLRNQGRLLHVCSKPFTGSPSPSERNPKPHCSPTEYDLLQLPPFSHCSHTGLLAVPRTFQTWSLSSGPFPCLECALPTCPGTLSFMPFRCCSSITFSVVLLFSWFETTLPSPSSYFSSLITP